MKQKTPEILESEWLSTLKKLAAPERPPNSFTAEQLMGKGMPFEKFKRSTTREKLTYLAKQGVVKRIKLTQNGPWYYTWTDKFQETTKGGKK